MIDDIAEIFLPLHDLRGIILRNLNTAPGHRRQIAPQKFDRVFRPADQIFVDLKRPGNALPIRFHPVNLRLVARRIVRRTQCKDAIVFRAVRILPLVLVQIRTAVVAFGLLQLGRRSCQPRNVVPAPGRLELRADRGIADVGLRSGNLNRLNIDNAFVCGRIVINHDHLALQLAGGIERFLAARIVNVQSAENDFAVRFLVAVDNTRRFLAHHFRQDVGRTVQFHELSRQIDRTAAIARIRPENVLRTIAGNR